MRSFPRPARCRLWPAAGIGPATRIAVGLSLGLMLVGTAPQRGAPLGPRDMQAPLARAADSPRVAVMVHGFQGLWPWSRGFRCSDGLVAYDEAGPPTGRTPRAEGEFGRLAQSLAEHGYDVYFARWTTHGGQTAGLRESGDCLAAQIAEARRRAQARAGVPVAQVTLVAHSMGGLVSRSYVEGGGYAARGDVEHLVTFGTPHLGVAPDILLRLLAAFNPAGIPGGLLPCASSPGICELSYEAVTAFNRAHKPRPGVTYNLVAGDKPIYPFSWFIAGADDGVVEAASASGLPVARWRVNDSHAALTGLVGDYYANSDESLRCLDTALGLAIGRPGCTPVAPAPGTPLAHRAEWSEPGGEGVEIGDAWDDAGDAGGPGGLGGPGGHDGDIVASGAGPAGSAPRLPLTPVLTGRLDAGASVTHPVPLDGAPGMLVVGRSGGWVESVLALPDGRSLRPKPQGRGPIAFRIDGAPAGTARLTLRNAGSSSADYAFFAALASPITLELDVAPGGGRWVGPGDRVAVSARLAEAGRGIPGGWVEAEWHDGERVRHLALTDAGDGSYRAELAAPARAGLYHVVVRAQGKGRQGWAVERETSRVVMVGGEDLVGAEDRVEPEALAGAEDLAGGGGRRGAR